MALKYEEPPTRSAGTNFLLYGPAGMGKTGAALSAPRPSLFLRGDTPNSTRFGIEKHGLDGLKIAAMESHETFTEVETMANAGELDGHTVILDTVGDAHRLVLHHLSGGAHRPRIDFYGDANIYIERFCRNLCENPNLNFIAVCHEWDLEGESVEKLPYTGTNKTPLGSKLMQMVDVVGYCSILEQEDAPPKHVAQLVNARGRRGKDRFNVLGPWRELDLSEWINVIREGDVSA